MVAHPNKVFTYDGVEFGIPHNADRDGQQKEYSAKKAHTLKNNTLCDDTQYLHYRSPTESGRMNDKKLADEYPLLLSVGSALRQDLGSLGHHPPGVVVEMPHKKPPKGVLTFYQQLYNQILSPL